MCASWRLTNHSPQLHRWSRVWSALLVHLLCVSVVCTSCLAAGAEEVCPWTLQTYACTHARSHARAQASSQAHAPTHARTHSRAGMHASTRALACMCPVCMRACCAHMHPFTHARVCAHIHNHANTRTDTHTHTRSHAQTRSLQPYTLYEAAAPSSEHAFVRTCLPHAVTGTLAKASRGRGFWN